VNVSRRHIKQVSIIIGFILINFLIVSILSKIYYEFNSGADRSTSLHIELKSNDYYLPKVTFQTSNSKGRKLNSEVLKNIKKDYLNAWYVKNYALKHNDIDSFRDFYTDSAQVKLTEMIQYNYKNKISVESTSLQHNLDIQFFSEDGQLVFLKDVNVEEIHDVNQNGVFIHKEQSFNDYDVVLLLEDGFWRVRHLIKTKQQEKKITKIESIKPLNFTIKGINYYPQKAAWLEFWNQFNDSIIDEDFKKIKKLKLNTIRIFIPYEVFGKATVSKQKLNNLKTTLDLADKNQLKVILTFFDFYSNYGISDYTLCDRHLEQIITEIKEHNAILQYDIKNEPDLDFKSHTKNKVLNWLSFISERIQQYDNKTPITIGWSSAEQAHHLKDEIDVVSFHYYKKPNNFFESYKKLKSKTDKSIIVQEFGKHSYNSFWFPFSNTEVSQAAYYKEMQKQFKLVDSINFVSWTLYDFPKIDASVFGILPHKIQPQKNYGIIDVHGNYKEASKFVLNSNEKIDVNSYKYFNNFFVCLVLTLLITIVIFVKYKKIEK